MFKNKIVLITGISSGIGKYTAIKFSKKNAIVIGTTQNLKFINFNKKIFYNKNIYIIYSKLNNYKSIFNVYKIIEKKFKRIDILINNSSIINDKLLINMEEKDWNNIININLLSIFRMSKLVLKFMIKNKFGRIINIGSIIGKIGNIGQSNYSASKSGLIGFTKSLSKEVAKFKITVNIISPGFIKSKMTNNLSNKIKKKFLEKIDIKRFGEIKEVVNVIMFISSNNSSYITGENINVNGGM